MMVRNPSVVLMNAGLSTAPRTSNTGGVDPAIGAGLDAKRSSTVACRLQPGRSDDPAPRAVRAPEPFIQRQQRTAERLGQCDVPSIVAGQVVPQGPHPLGKRRERKQRHVKPKQIPVSTGGFKTRDLARPFQPAQDVGRLDQCELGSGRSAVGEHGFRPFPFASRIDQDRDERGRINDDRHVRSASRARRMLDGCTRVPAAAFRLRTPCNHAASDGREAMRSSSLRRNSCMDWRCNAARAASSSRTSSGTLLIVI